MNQETPILNDIFENNPKTKIPLKHKIIATLVVATALTTAIALKPSRVGPDYLYPDPTLTPGLVATTDFNELTSTYTTGCNGIQTPCTYSQSHRHTTSKMKTDICNEYPVNCKSEPTPEADHACPLALGCADDERNLWYQPAVNMWNGVDYGFHTKDKLESYLVIQMKAGKISPSDAQQCILKDWVACYQKYFNRKLGSVDNSVVSDPDDL